MKIRYVFPTYSADAPCAIQALRSILAFGVLPEDCMIADERGKPLSDEHRAQVEAMGAKVIPSRYTRRNLYTDLIAKLQLYSCHDGDWTVNVDSDTVIADLDSYLAVPNGGFVAASFAWAGCEFSGCASMVKTDAARECLADVLSKNSLRFPSEGFPDDVAIGKLLDFIFGEKAVLRWPANKLGWYIFERNWQEMSERTAIHFGQKKLARELAKGKAVRSVIADHMREYIDWKITQ